MGPRKSYADASERRAPGRSAVFLVAAAWGAVLGAADALAALLQYHDGPTAVAGPVLLVGTAVVAALSTLVGGALGLLGRALDLHWAAGGVYRQGVLWVPRRTLLSLWIGFMAVVVSLCFIAFPVRPPWGMGRVAAGLGAGAAGLCTLVVVHRASHHKWVEMSAWALVVVTALHLQVRTLYQFSRLWPTWSIELTSNAFMSLAHSLGLLVLLTLLITLTCMLMPARWLKACGPRPRVAWALVGAAAVVFVAARPVVSLASEQAGVLLHERSVLAFRTLELAPRFRSSTLPDLQEPTRGAAARVGEERRVQGVLLVLVDALRADVLGAEVAGQPVAPSLQAFGQSAVQFARAYCTVPATKESVGAMLTGSRTAHLEPAALRQRSLGPLLRAAGVTTIGIYGHDALLDTFAPMDRPVAFGSGPSNKHRLTSDITLAAVARQLEEVENEPFFMVAHFYDPHSHYLPNDEFDFGTSDKQAYLAEVAYTDRRLGRLFDLLHSSGLDESVAVIVVSDHGEEFWDHGYRWHRKRVYEESARVVLQVRVPGTAPAVVTTPVTLVDVAPTVLHLLGAPIPDGLDGISLVPILEGHTPPSRRIVVTAGDASAVALIEGDQKLIVHATNHVIELFDLGEDPREHRNLADARPAEVARMLRARE
jgi:hypothetical protein